MSRTILEISCADKDFVGSIAFQIYLENSRDIDCRRSITLGSEPIIKRLDINRVIGGELPGDTLLRDPTAGYPNHSVWRPNRGAQKGIPARGAKFEDTPSGLN